VRVARPRAVREQRDLFGVLAKERRASAGQRAVGVSRCGLRACRRDRHHAQRAKQFSIATAAIPPASSRPSATANRKAPGHELSAYSLQPRRRLAPEPFAIIRDTTTRGSAGRHRACQSGAFSRLFVRGCWLRIDESENIFPRFRRQVLTSPQRSPFSFGTYLAGPFRSVPMQIFSRFSCIG